MPPHVSKLTSKTRALLTSFARNCPRLLNLCVLGFLASCGTLDPDRVGNRLHPDSSASVSELQRQAEGFRLQGKFSEAEILLTKAVQADGDEMQASLALAKLHCEFTLRLAAQKKLKDACNKLEQARTSKNRVLALSVSPGVQKPDLNEVVKCEKSFLTTEREVTRIVDGFCSGLLADAQGSAKEAKRLFTKNERDLVVQGLKQIRGVLELSEWLSNDIRGETVRVMAELKNLVDQDEWDGLLARAGIDPSVTKRTR